MGDKQGNTCFFSYQLVKNRDISGYKNIEDRNNAGESLQQKGKK